MWLNIGCDNISLDMTLEIISIKSVKHYVCSYCKARHAEYIKHPKYVSLKNLRTLIETYFNNDPVRCYSVSHY